MILALLGVFQWSIWHGVAWRDLLRWDRPFDASEYSAQDDELKEQNEACELGCWGQLGTRIIELHCLFSMRAVGFVIWYLFWTVGALAGINQRIRHKSRNGRSALSRKQWTGLVCCYLALDPVSAAMHAHSQISVVQRQDRAGIRSSKFHQGRPL